MGKIQCTKMQNLNGHTVNFYSDMHEIVSLCPMKLCKSHLLPHSMPPQQSVWIDFKVPFADFFVTFMHPKDGGLSCFDIK